MAIGYARIEFVKRSSGKNACAKAAYNSRSRVEFEGTDHQDPAVYDWSKKEPSAHHEVLLPKNVDSKFISPEKLWNLAEQAERRINSVTACELVLALPDDSAINLEDRIHLANSFIQQHFVSHGLAAQIDIHSPERAFIITRDNQELGLKKGMTGQVINRSENSITVQFDTGANQTINPKEFTGFIQKDHNWHAHVLVTTRCFADDGLTLQTSKARDFIPRVSKEGRIISGPDWGKLWTEHQNNYFEAKGLDLRVDPNGLIAQEHLGPHRMRGRAFSLFEEHNRRLDLNQQTSADPVEILKAITSKRSVFTRENVQHFIAKHTPAESVLAVYQAFWNLPEIIQLVDKSTGEVLQKFSTQVVLEEEERILRLADRLQAKNAFPSAIQGTIKDLTQEQEKAYHQIIQGKRLTCIQGYAGTGKSHLLKALQHTYGQAGYRVRAFGPDSATTNVLKEKGLSHTENVYRFLFGLHHKKRKILAGQEVWMLDEAGKLGNAPLLELLKEADKNNIQLILSGDASQLSPVERGGMFSLFCERYGAQSLIDIQRQQNQQLRKTAQLLATGEFGSAIDQMTNSKGIRWTENKKEAIEELITQWAKDSRTFPTASTLIISHSNAELRVLNELVRQIRRQRGELAEKEFQCTTTQGKIFVSVGDRIEFRRIDKALGVDNGLSGVLIEAEHNRFIVSVRKDDKSQQTVVFNPEEYRAFQLGYASTYYRSQGRTIDRAYVLHSSMTNKEMFYVGLTRHVKNVLYFVSKEEVSCLADLKRLSSKSGRKQVAIEYTTQHHLEELAQERARHQTLEELKESGSILDRVKGHGLTTWDKVVEKAVQIKDRIQDSRPSKQFYQPVLTIPDSEKSPVIDVTQLYRSLQSEPDGSSAQGLSTATFALDTSLKSPLIFSKKSTTEGLKLFQDYSNSCEEVSALKQVVMAEAEASLKDVRFSPHFKKWQEACGLRNQQAYSLVQQIPACDREAISPKSLEIIQEQASRHELFLSTKEKPSKQDLDDRLKTHVEPLLYRLYPEGPTSRDRHHFRFGSKGSLSIAHSGPKVGQFYDFEKQQGGSLLKLIQIEMGLGKKEACTWAEDFLGGASTLAAPKTFFKQEKGPKLEDTWVSLKPDPNHPAPSLEGLKGKYLSKFFTEVYRHAYRDEKGELLYYVLRLQEKNNPKQKITPPLSYGYWTSNPDHIGWDLKGYQEGQKSLYNLHLLKQKPTTPVLIVEGEKTADKASSKFAGESYICVTWPGGAGAASRADWAPLIGRKIFIWPDNDPAGELAAEKVCHELRKVGVESLQLVKGSDLKTHFPEKWDLADALPQGISEHFPKKLLVQSSHKAINPEQVMLRLSLNPKDPVARARTNEILWRVDEGLRAELEQQHTNSPWKIQDEILKKTQQLILTQEKQKPLLRDKFGLESKALDSLAYQVCLAQAQKGRSLRLNEIESIREIIQQSGYVALPKTEDRALSEIVTDRMLSTACGRVLNIMPADNIFPSRRDKDLSIETIEKHAVQISSIQLDNGSISKDSGFNIKF